MAAASGATTSTPRELADKGALGYLTLEYLAELTLSILALQRQRNPEAGYATDFLDVLESLIPHLKDQPHLKIVTNAGGMNPRGCGVLRPRHPGPSGVEGPANRGRRPAMI